MKNIFGAFFLIVLFASACIQSKSKIENRIGITDSKAQSLLNLPFGSDFKAIKSVGKEIPLAIEYFKEMHDYYGEAYCSRLYGVFLTYNGDFNKAQVAYLRAYDLFDKLNKPLDKAKVCNAIANNYAEIGSMILSVKYFQEALKIGQSINDSTIQANVIMNMGINYRTSKPDSALFYYQNALKFVPVHPVDNIKVKIEYNMANILYEKKEFDKATDVYQMVVDDGLAKNNLEAVAVGYSGLASVSFVQKKYDHSFFLFKHSMHLMDSLGQRKYLIQLMPEMISSYEKIGDYKNAYVELKNLKQLSDSLLNIEKEVAVHELDIQYQTEKKEVENIQLKNDLRLKRLAIIILIVIVFVLFYLFRNRARLVEEKRFAYDVLMDKYRLESKQRKKHANILAELETVKLSNLEMSLIEKIIKYYVVEKPFLNAKLRVDDIAKYFNVSQKEISTALKNYDNSNFNSFTNKYRVEEARRKFENPEFVNYKMEVIAQQSGFGTIQSFYNAFELYTGVKPSYYRMQALDK